MVSEIDFLLATKLTLAVIASALFTMIWKYLSQKSLGKQTLLDLMVKEYIKSVTMVIVVTMVPFIELNELDLDKTMIHFMAKSDMFLIEYSMVFLLGQVLCSTMIRYLVIFHQGLLDEIEDLKIVKVSRMVSFSMAILSGIMCVFENGSMFYIYMTGIECPTCPVPKFYIKKIMVVLNLMAIGYVQFSIEIGNLTKCLKI